MNTTFAEELRAGLQLVAPALSAVELQSLARARDLLNLEPEDRDQILARFVLAYRRGPKQLWAPVILDLLAPAMVECLQGLRAEPPTSDEEDLRQQLVLQVLKAATQAPMRDDLSGMRIRLMSRANQAMVRWLKRQARHRSWHYSLEATEEQIRR